MHHFGGKGGQTKGAKVGALWLHLLVCLELLLLLMMLQPSCSSESLFSSWRGQDGADPIGQLNDKLVDLTPASKLAENVEAARQFKQTAEFERQLDEPTRKALVLFSRLDASHICEPENMANLRQLHRLANSKQRDELAQLGSQRRLMRLLQELTFQAKWNCFVAINLHWANAGPQLTTRFESNFPELRHFSALLEGRGSSGPAEQLRGALGLARLEDEPAKLEKQLSGRKMGAVLRQIHRLKTGLNHLKVDEKTGKTFKVDAQIVGPLLEAYLLEPCKRLLEQPETTSLLKPAADLLVIGRLDELVRVVARFGRHSFEWTARFITCDLLLKLEPSRLAERLAKTAA